MAGKQSGATGGVFCGHGVRRPKRDTLITCAVVLVLAAVLTGAVVGVVLRMARPDPGDPETAVSTQSYVGSSGEAGTEGVAAAADGNDHGEAISLTNNIMPFAPRPADEATAGSIPAAGSAPESSALLEEALQTTDYLAVSSAPAPAVVSDTSTMPQAADYGESNVDDASNGAGTSSRALWGLTYSPYNDDGSCPDLGTVTWQLQRVSAVASNIRLYSTDCSQLRNAVQAIETANLALGVYAGIWLAAGSERMEADLEEFVSVAKTFGTGLIRGLSVGNEDRFNGMPEDVLIASINSVRLRLQQEGLGAVPVYTTDVDSAFSPAMAAASDVVQVNVYSVYDSAYSSVGTSVASVVQRAGAVRSGVAGGKPVRIGECGWASAGDTGPSPLTVGNEASFAQGFKCAAEAAGLDYFYFEAKDATWKPGAALATQSFGIFDSEFNPKFDFGLLGTC
ncbi:hypothetical protein GGI11_001316 [Coemansia sp. RSA 2049]|nr:hypothetical protein GGI11_001316 [Coemansia sp. RSA 2049]